MNNKTICRWCANYHPDERYKGVIGICEIDRKARELKEACKEFKKGPQTWMNGEKVEQ